MTPTFDELLESLTPIQRDAVGWDTGAILVLAGPGAGKTRVLTTRITRLLKDSEAKRFRILALTFTTKAAAEMRERVDAMLPEGIADERTFIGTFHAFCTQVLRQHGSHIGIKPDFGIYGLKVDQEAFLKDAIREAMANGEPFVEEDVNWLPTIESMKSRLLTPEKAASRVSQQMANVYSLYESKLRAENAIDFNGLILETCRLLAKFPAIAARLRASYPYWLIDEFQDTSPAQYWLLHYLSGGAQRNIFVVADDDQIIFQFAGASYRQIEKFRAQYKPSLIQLVDNHRCPPGIVEVANRLVSYNTQRTPEKTATVAARAGPINVIETRQFDTDTDEQQAIATDIASKQKNEWGKIVILARTRALLNSMLGQLKKSGVNAVFVQRRDNFISPQFVWLEALLSQSLHPTNKRIFTTLVNAANRITGLELDSELLITEAEFAGLGYCEHWARSVSASDSSHASDLGDFVKALFQSRSDWKKVVKSAIALFTETAAPTEDGTVSDFVEDHTAWVRCLKEIRAETGQAPELVEFVQGLSLRSKEPPRNPDAVSLLTIHTAKGLEFEYVYVIGLAEGEMPSWQSLNKGDDSPEMEEERRNCFVAVTRTQEHLTLSYALNYRGFDKEPSRFLREMGLLN